LSNDVSARLTALGQYNILDTPREEGFDDITAIAALVCGAPIALVNLIASDRQFFKSEIGMGRSQSPIAGSVCALALNEDEIFVAPDLRLDARFAKSALVTGPPFLRFYAGAKLVTPRGVPIGMVCVLDTVPRPKGITKPQADILRALARQTISLLEFRKVTEERRLISNELTHRVKNVFAMVSALANLSLRKAPEAKQFVAEFQSRLTALSMAHDLVLERQRDSADASRSLHELLALMLNPYRGIDGKRWTVSGDDLPVGPHMAQALVLLIHELATNAVKYGALSDIAGQIDIAVARSDGAVTIRWEEHRGPKLKGPPERVGFGTTLIDMAVTGANCSVVREWRPGGLYLTLSAPESRFTN
jgi:two-component sensor histidine kinase